MVRGILEQSKRENMLKLRDAPRGMTLHNIGKHITVDWNPADHREWLHTLLQSLVRDRLIRIRSRKFVLG